METNRFEAWAKFAESGKISDYLNYKNLSHMSQENKTNANEHGRTGNKGAQNKR